MNRVEALRACAEITRREARNFHYGLRLLPARPRLALYAVYAWMRVLDDLADDPGRSAEEGREAIERFEAATRAVLAGSEAAGADARERAVLAGIAWVAGERALDPADIAGAIEGQRMDLEPRVYANFAETELYCDRVAATVGRICLDVWGVRDGADAVLARELSTKRGIAFQLVNILRDIREDRARGRCYLPADEFAANGLTVDSLLGWQDAARCARFMEVQCARAERIFAESAPLETLVAREAVPTLAAMSSIYRGILRKIARDPRGALERRARLSALEKSWIALRARLGLLGGAR
ncbi:MAG: phytoene/squalene synthase family protein [Planctomycetota bacterium]